MFDLKLNDLLIQVASNAAKDRCYRDYYLSFINHS